VREVFKVDRDKAYNIVISECIKAIEIKKDNEDLVSDFWHCIAQIENIKRMFNN
jgi:hypothetical protein